MTSEDLSAGIAAVGHARRLRVGAELAAGRKYVSEQAGSVVGHLETCGSGKARSTSNWHSSTCT